MAAGSIITRNIERLGQKFLSQVNYLDIDYRGKTEDPPAGLLDFAAMDQREIESYKNYPYTPTIKEGAVLVNNLKLWLMSSSGDYYRRAGFGGFLDNIHQYPLSSKNAEELRTNLLQAVEAQFATIEVIHLMVEADIANRGWRLQIIVKDTISGIIGAFNTLLESTQ